MKPAAASPSDTVDLDVLWQPLPLRGVTLPNRVMCSATTLQYGVDGLITDRHLAFYRERARGGVGLLFTEQLASTPLSDTAFPGSIHAYDERQVQRFEALAAELEPYPTAMFAQLVAAGAKGASTAGIDDWGPVRAPSRVPAPGGEVPLPLEEPELDLIAADFARSARHVREGGLDGVEVHGAHGWLVGQFLSPFFNRRDDGYGGDVESRCRFALEVGRAIRAEVGDDFPVGLALTYDEVIGDAGITTDDTEAQLDVLAAAGVYDFFDLSIGAPHAGHLTISSMAVPTGYALPFARRATAVVAGRAAVFVAGRVVDLATAARAVREGDADVVAMTRAHLADAHHVRKARSGRRSEITRCIGANVCVGRALRGVQVSCVLNPVTGREQALGEGTLRPAATPRRVVVVGAGPPGCAWRPPRPRAATSSPCTSARRRPGAICAISRRSPPGSPGWKRSRTSSPRSSGTARSSDWRAHPMCSPLPRKRRTSSSSRPGPSGRRPARPRGAPTASGFRESRTGVSSVSRPRSSAGARTIRRSAAVS